MKKLISLVLALAMVALCIGAAVADDPTYTITINNTNNNTTIVGKQYSAYKVFDMTYTGSATTDPHTYSIKSTDWAWDYVKGTADATGVYTNSTYGFKFTPTATDPTLYMLEATTTGEQARALADALQSHLPSSPSATSGTATTETVTFGVPAPGYYVVYGTVDAVDGTDGDKEVVAALALTSTDPTATVVPKVEVPPLNKKITGEHVLDDKGQAAIAQVGTSVSFELDSKVPDLTGYSDYTFTITDTMTSGLTYNEDVALSIGGTTVETTAYTFNFSSDTNSFTLTIPYNTLKAKGKGDNIVVTYSATLNSNAISTDQENNTAKLTYSHSPYDNETNETPEKKVYVIDVNIDVNKYTGADKEVLAGKLANAEFKLYKNVTVEGTTTQQFYKLNNGVVTWVAKDASDTFVTKTDGKFTTQIQGLEAGTYYLLETKAPDGYNLLAQPIEITITAAHTADANTATITATNANVIAGTIDLTDTSAGQPVVFPDVQNNAGTELPSTGGIGTTIFYIVGGLLLVGAAIVLVARRKASEN